MAEICLDCWNKLNGTHDSPAKYILSKELDLCEECGEWKHVIVLTRGAYYRRKLRFLILPAEIILSIVLIPFVPIALLIRKIQDKRKR